MQALKFVAFVLAALAFACRPPASGNPGDGDGDADADADTDVDSDTDRDTAVFACNPGEWNCWLGAYYECGSDGASRLNETPCENACSPDLGCVLCLPGSRRCEGTTSMVCGATADQWFYGRECSDWGSECIPDTGFCGDACAEAFIAQVTR